MRNIGKSVRGGALAIVLSLAMVVSVFAGTGMEVRAEGEFWLVAIGLPDDQSGLNALSSQLDVFTQEEKTRFEEFIKKVSNNDTSDIVYLIYVQVSGVDTPKELWGWYKGSWKNCTLHEDIPQPSDADPKSYSYYVVKRPTTSSSAPQASQAPHTHSYSWVTVQEVTAEQDGIEEYRCSCGDVQARSVLPAYMVFVKGLYGAIKDAPQNGTATFDSGRLCTISDYVIRKLSERPDVTTVITFTYQNQKYKMTIPAGVDYTSLLADEEYFYGYFYFANAVGATIEAL